MPNAADSSLEHATVITDALQSNSGLISDILILKNFKYDFYFSSNANSNAGTQIRFKSGDFGIEGGIGFNFYFAYFTLSPELKFSNGLSTFLVADPSYKYASVFSDLKTRMVAFSLHFEY